MYVISMGTAWFAKYIVHLYGCTRHKLKGKHVLLDPNQSREISMSQSSMTMLRRWLARLTKCEGT